MVAEVFVNARHRLKETTGVQRYAEEILRRFPANVRCLAPHSARFATGVLGHAWEQIELPRQVAANRVLWSPCNTGPLRARRHVITLHDAAFLDYPDAFTSRFREWYKWLVPRLIRSAAKVLTVSRFSARQLASHFDISADDIAVIPNGVDPRFRPQPAAEHDRIRAKYQLPKEFALTLGSLEARKNLAGVLAAWRSSPRLENVPLVVAGGRAAAFRELPELASAHAQFLGYVPDEDLPALYSSASLLVFISLYEGFGLPPLEAMACGTPTVVSDTTALPEVVGDAAFRVDPRCPEAVADAVLRLLHDESLRTEMVQAGIKRARRFDWNTTALKVWKVLAEI